MLKPLKSLATAAFAIAAVVFTNAPAVAQSGAAVVDAGPGKAGMMQTLNVTASITAIDKAKRDVTLKGPQGNQFTVTAGPEVKNFDKLKVGDQVDMKYAEAVTMELKKGGGMIVSRTEQKGAAGAKPGATPAGVDGPRGYDRRRRRRRRPREANDHAERAGAHRRPARRQSRAVQAHREGRSGRGEVHPGARDLGRAEEVSRRSVAVA